MTSWLWTGERDAPAGAWTWFRTVVHLDEAPTGGSLRLAADSTARLSLNGVTVRRKVARFHERDPRCEVVDASPWLRRGPNVLVVLHHSWGDVQTFQRSGQRRAGLYVAADWLPEDVVWRHRRADHLAAGLAQFRGVHEGAARIRYPVHLDGAALHDRWEGLDDPSYDDSSWPLAVPVVDGPWPRQPADVETPGQREVPVRPAAVVAAGAARYPGAPDTLPAPSAVPGSGVTLLSSAQLAPSPGLTAAAGDLVGRGTPLDLVGRAGESAYLTVDFQRPVHGYPFLDVGASTAGVRVDLGYGELASSPHDGRTLVGADGWVDVDAVVAPGYADCVHLATARQRVEVPDERTARWLTLHVHFTGGGGVVRLHGLGFVSSQYPVRPRGTFESGDALLERLVALGRVHAEVTMTDAYVDTPGREDGQWIEDARPRAELAARWFGDTALRRLAIRTIAQGQQGDGQFHPFPPSNYEFDPGRWDWSLEWAGMLADDHRWRADDAFTRSHLPALERLWDGALALVGADGVWRSPDVFADIRVSPSVPPDGSSAIGTAWVLDRLHESAALAERLGETGLARRWRASADRVAAGFRAVHVVRDRPGAPVFVADVWGPRTGATDRGCGQAAQVLPLSRGDLLAADEAAALLDAAFPAPDASPPDGMARWNNPTWLYRALTVLVDRGHAERAVAHLLERCGPYLPTHPRNPTPLPLQGPLGGPLPEYWHTHADAGLALGTPHPAQPPDPTGSHGWAALPLLWLHESLLGVRIVEPGGSRLSVRPVTGGLPFVAGTTATPRGLVHVHLDPAVPLLEVTLPVGCSADVTLPGPLVGCRTAATAPDGTLGPEVVDGTVHLDAPGPWTLRPTAPRW